MKYLARSQALLREGEFIADVCRLVADGENYGQGPWMATLPEQYDPIPIGYNFDYLSDKALLEEMTVKQGRLVTRRGSSYRAHQMPNGKALTPAVLRKLRDLVQAGAVIIGPKPERSPSLEDYPDCDRDIADMGNAMWGNIDRTNIIEHRFGQGKVFAGQALKIALDGVCDSPDLTFVLDRAPDRVSLLPPTQGPQFPRTGEADASMPTTGLNWIHRRTRDADIYFVANPQYRPVNALCSFRVSGQQPELWDPATGKTETVLVFRHTQHGTEIPLHFDPAGSIFVVFRKKVNRATQIVEMKRDGTLLFGTDAVPTRLPVVSRKGKTITLSAADPGHYEVRFGNGVVKSIDAGAAAQPFTIVTPWAVQFQPGRGAPATATFSPLLDWSKHADEGIRFFSGTASYVTEFDWSPANPRGAERLDLGDVQVMAEVKLNGRDLGVLWKPPFQVDVRDALKPGRNKLEIKVTNLWPNRLIGDERFPDDCTADGSWKLGPIPAWPDWLTRGQPRPESRRITFTTWKYFTKESPLLPSGLLGPVTIQSAEEGSPK
jgi:hypothetical protein